MEKKVAEAYGVVGGGGSYATRHTIYIGKDGKILFVDRSVKPPTAGQDMAARLGELGVDKTD